MPPRATLLRWLVISHWRSSPGRTAVSAVAVALGVTLALGIHLVNSSALEEFRQAIATVNGEAHAQLTAASGALDETVFARLAREPAIEAASPVLELETRVADAPAQRLRIIALDVFRAAAVTPALVPVAQASDGPGSGSPLFADDTIFLSQAALQRFGLDEGDRIALLSGLRRIELRIAGTVPRAPPGQLLAVMDLGAAQWRFDALGQLTRVDLRLQPGVPVATLERQLRDQLPPQAVWSTPQAAEQRMSNLSRAYRVNLNVLALVALFTGGFIVFASMTLAVVKQQAALALLGVLGAPPAMALRIVLLQGAATGAIGSLAGVAGGIALAGGLLRVVGGDLGGGYFPASHPRLLLEPWPIAGFAALGVAVALAGSVLPALAAQRLAPARAMRSGAAEDTLARRPPIRLAAALAIGGAALLAMPPIAGLPIPAYLAIAAWLFAGIACVPALTAWCGATLQALLGTRAWRMPPAWLALTQIAASPGAVSAALAGVVASFALASAMVFMVTSFRTSVDQWLDRVLPADLYARAPAALSGGFDAQTLHALQSLQGITRMQLARATELTLDPARPPVTLIARDLEAGAIQRQLPITGTVSQVPHGAVPLYVSEAMADGYGWVPGRRVDLPLPAAAQREQAFVVAAVWRDYARQHGAVVIDRADYRRLTGDQTISEAALWLDDGVRLDAVVEQALQRVPQLRDAELRSAADIRALSLRIFDRSFAVTYALEAMAILVALFGVAATFAGEALARAREFGMLRHFGFTRAQIARQVALEAAGSVAVAVAWGGALGTLIGLVLIRRVNPQSFHWTMDAVWPADLLLGSAAVLVASATLAAVIAARSATGDDPVRAVRQDW